jgi:hypothetical protein
MSRHRPSLRNRAPLGELPPDFYVVPGPWPCLGRPVKHDVSTWRVLDDWPARVPVTHAKSTFSKRGSAIFSTSYSGHADDVRRHLL